MYHKSIAGPSGASSAQHDQPAHDEAPRQSPTAPTGGEHSLRRIDSQLAGLPTGRRSAAPFEIEEDGSDHESDTSSLFQGPPSSHIGSARIRSLHIDFPSAFPSTRTTAPRQQTNVPRGQTQAETQGAPSGGGRSLTASLQHAYGRAAELGAKAKGIASSGIAAAGSGIAATAHGGRQVIGAGVRHAAQAGASAVSGLGVARVSPRFMAAAAGHLVHQAAGTGVPTFAREMMYEALYAALRQVPQPAVTAMQVATGVATLGLHRLRQVREQRNPEAAARGFHNLSAEQWEALPHEEKQAKMAEQREYSDAVTSLATASVLMNVAMSAAGPSMGQPHLGAQVLATDLKVMAYAAARDAIQASFRMVNTEAETNGGVSGAHLHAAGEFYAKANFAANVAFGAVPVELSEARTKLAATFGDKDAQAALALQPSPLSMGQALGTVAHSSLVKATINTLLETSDWIHVTEQEANEAGTRQRLDPALTGTDYGRVLDQSVTRTAVIGSNISLGNVLGIIAAKLQAPAWLSSLMNNGGPAVAAGLTYGTIARTWQAEAAVRNVEDRRPSGTAAQAAEARTEEPRGSENV